MSNICIRTPANSVHGLINSNHGKWCGVMTINCVYGLNHSNQECRVKSAVFWIICCIYIWSALKTEKGGVEMPALNSLSPWNKTWNLNRAERLCSQAFTREMITSQYSNKKERLFKFFSTKVIWNPQQGGKHECVPLEFDKVDNSIACFSIEYKYNKLSQILLVTVN